MNEDEGAFGTQYGDTYPGMLQKVLVAESRHRTRTYYLGNPDAFDAQDITAFLAKHPGCTVKVDWMIVPMEGGEPVGPFDTRLTDYPSTVTLGDYTSEGWKNVRKYSVLPQPHPFTKEAGVFPDSGVIETGMVDMGMPSHATTADLDQRDHFASDVRALHPTPDDRLMSAIDELNEKIVTIMDMLRAK